ncbi:MAG: hypothetical protein KBE16_01880 [Alphaproteobacteria bacterium]|jgi:hypothetical protein|nr:hypothetical protein [Alphaproteobacteria bacterium]MBP9877660.1 hypothetical protein [Alphaproteobacteria bacterium]
MSFIPKISTTQPGASLPNSNLGQSVNPSMPKGGVKVMPSLDLKGQMPLLKKKVAIAPKEVAIAPEAEATKRTLPNLPKKQVLVPKTPQKAEVVKAPEAPVVTSPRVVPPKEPKQIGKLVMPSFTKEEPAALVPKAEISDLPKGRVSDLRNVVGAQLMKKQPAAPIEPAEQDIVLYNGPDPEVEDDIIELPRVASPSFDDDIVFSHHEEPDFLLFSIETSYERSLMVRDGQLSMMTRASLSVSVTPLYLRPASTNSIFLPF